MDRATMKPFTSSDCSCSSDYFQHFHLVDPEPEANEYATRVSRNKELSSSCHTVVSNYDSGEEQRRPQRQMRRLSFGSCHTTVEFDRKMPVNESLLNEYDSPTTVMASRDCRWNAEILISPLKKRYDMPKQSRPTWTAHVDQDTSKAMPKLPSRIGGASSDVAPTLPNLRRRAQPC
ncbi:hypothetical protein MPSEU_001029500 [Mayamaea pseudoterrestris]|nr:hypothetical protein MPSEU_001029500 [Mayamaea pseudoterrestris]